MKRLLFFALISISCTTAEKPNYDPLKTEIITSDLHNFWRAFDSAGQDFTADSFQRLYINEGTKGIKGFMKGRIVSAEHLSKVISTHKNYYTSIRSSTEKIDGMKEQIRNSLVKLKDIYPEAVFPPVYFVVGALSSGGTSSSDGLIIGAEMYGLTDTTPKDELNNWLKAVIKPVDAIPHIVAHELIHFQQPGATSSLLSACIHEGAADFIAELMSGHHINEHVHDFANPREKELWEEFSSRMNGKEYDGWLYSTHKDRPNDLGYWIGYKICKAYYEKQVDKRKAIKDIITVRNFKQFLTDSGYGKTF